MCRWAIVWEPLLYTKSRKKSQPHRRSRTNNLALIKVASGPLQRAISKHAQPLGPPVPIYTHLGNIIVPVLSSFAGKRSKDTTQRTLVRIEPTVTHYKTSTQPNEPLREEKMRVQQHEEGEEPQQAST